MEKMSRTKHKVRLPPLVDVDEEKEIEKWEIKHLPSDWNPITKPSIILQNYLKRKQEEQTSIIETLTSQRTCINRQVEAYLRSEATHLVRYLDKIQIEIDRIVERNKVNDDVELIFQNNNFEASIRVIRRLHMTRAEKLNRFLKYLCKLENSRSDAHKKILKQAYTRLIRNNCSNCWEVTKYFEREIIEINEITLGNVRTRFNIMHELALRYEDELRQSILMIQVYKDKWYDIIKSKLVNIFNDENLKQVPERGELFINKEHAEQMYKQFAQQDTKLSFICKKFDPMHIRAKDLKAFSKEIDKTVNKFDSCALNLIKMYKVAYSGVFNGYFEGVKSMTQHLLQFGLADHEDAENIETEFCLPLVETITKRYDMELSDLQQLWNSVLAKLQTKLKTTFTFLVRSADLWEEHYKRLNNAKAAVLKDLYQTIAENDKISQKAEINLNIHLDSVRQEILEDIDKPLATIFAMLDSFLKMYHEHYDTEVAVIMKYKGICRIAADVIVAELKRFLHFNPKDQNFSPGKLKYLSEDTPASSAANMDIRAHLIPKQIKMCQYHTGAVQNWMFGLWEAIEKCIYTTAADIEFEAENWIKDNIIRISKRLEVKLAIHQPRYATIKEDCYDLRKTRLEVLKARIERHSAGVKSTVERVSSILGKSEDMCRNILDDYASLVENELESIRYCQNEVILRMHSLDIEHVYDKQVEQILVVMKKCNSQIREELIKLKEAQLTLVKKIKFFHELGNCQYKESLQIIDVVKKLDKEIEKMASVSSKNAEKLHEKYYRLINVQKSYLLQIALASKDEFNFNNDVVVKIKELQASIKREVYNIKFEIKKSKAFFQDFKYQGSQHLGDFQFVDNTVRLGIETLDVLKTTGNSLKFPNNLSAEPNIILKEQSSATIYPEEKNINTPKSAKRKNKNQEGTDYTVLLLEIKPINDGTFIGKNYNSIYESFQNVQEFAKNFYGKHSKIINEGRVQSTFQNFMGEVLGKYLLYIIQVDSYWLSQAKDFRKLSSEFYLFIEDFVRRFLRQYKLNEINKLKENFNSLKKCLIELRSNLRIKYRKLHGRLCPNYAHPLNCGLFDAVDKKMKGFLATCCKSMHELIHPYLEFSKCEYENYKLQLPIIEKKLNFLIQKIKSENTNIKLLKQIAIKADYMRRLKSMGNINSNEKSSVELAAITRVMNFKSQLPQPSEDIIAETFVTPGSLESKTTNSQIENVDEDVSEVYKKTHRDIKEVENSSYQDCKKWEEVWQSDSRRIRQLYTVKYDIPK